MKENKRLLDLIWIMTAAGWSRSDIMNLIDNMRNLPFSELHDLISHAKSRQEEFKASLLYGRGEMHFKASPQTFASNDTAEKVVFLLRAEAGLTTIEAIEAMSAGLRKIDRGRAEHLPGYSKQSLGQWIDRAAQLFSPSELLYVATTARNASVHGSPLDWNLRKNEP